MANFTLDQLTQNLPPGFLDEAMRQIDVFIQDNGGRLAGIPQREQFLAVYLLALNHVKQVQAIPPGLVH